MRSLFFICSFVFALTISAQNNLHLFTGSGKVFRMLQNEKYISATPQADVVLTKIKADTLRLKIEFDGKRFGATFYLLSRTRHTSNKEFSYRVEPLKDKLEVVYMGMDSLIVNDQKLVPDKPSATIKQ